MDTGVLVIVLESAVLVGLVPAFLARAKGRSFVGWWLYGAAAIVVALPHILLLDSDSSADNDSRDDAVRPSHCPSCKEAIRPNAVACRHCGYSFVDDRREQERKAASLGEAGSFDFDLWQRRDAREAGPGQRRNGAGSDKRETADRSATDRAGAERAAACAAASPARMTLRAASDSTRPPTDAPRPNPAHPTEARSDAFKDSAASRTASDAAHPQAQTAAPRTNPARPTQERSDASGESTAPRNGARQAESERQTGKERQTGSERMTKDSAKAGADIPLPWSEDDFARIREHGPKASTGSTPRQDRTEMMREMVRRPPRRLVFAAVCVALAVWVGILGFTILMPSPQSGPQSGQSNLAAASPPHSGAVPDSRPDSRTALAPPSNAASAVPGMAPVETAKPSSPPTVAADSPVPLSGSPMPNRIDGGDPRALAAPLPLASQAVPFRSLATPPTIAEKAPPPPAPAASDDDVRTGTADRKPDADAARRTDKSGRAARLANVAKHKAKPKPPRALTPHSGSAAASSAAVDLSPEAIRRSLEGTAEPQQGEDNNEVTAVGELVFWMQRRLADLGYFHGPVNGRAGSETRRAILAYQRAAHLTPTGRINEALIVSLRRAPAKPVASRSSR